MTPTASAGRRGGAIAAAILLAYAAAILLRMPEIVRAGRFWAEEGTVFYTSAWRSDPLTALLTPYGGYLNLVANGATLLARWAVPVEAAPFVTIGTGLTFQLLPPLLLITARDAWLRPWLVRIAGLALLLLAPATAEIWLQTLHCQFELTLACGLLLALEVRTGRRAVLPVAVLALAPLCGPGAIALLPLFMLRAFLERSGGRTLQCAALATGSACQLAFFFSFGTTRGYTVDPAVLLAVVTVKNLLVPLAGAGPTFPIAAELHRAALAGHVPFLACMAPIVVFGALGWVVWRWSNGPAFWLLAAAAATALSAYIGALDGTVELLNAYAGERYTIVPVSLVGLCALALAARPGVRWPAALACGWLLVVGYHSFVRPPLLFHTGPAWREQVARWRADPAYAMQIWPAGWTVVLPLPIGRRP